MKAAWLLLAPLALLAACAPDNVAACESFVDHYNGLACVEEDERFDAANNCPETLNVTAGDCSAYYECLTENAFCDEAGELVYNDAECVYDC